ncbi:DedA family protein [Cellulomonas sp. NTE-D12]|uniref:DedA family protein n=1 Tax=Cellulomonas sp. NTE-D12 TaxID=2962632 RepID=UPI003081CDC7
MPTVGEGTSGVQEWALALVGSPWVFAALYAFATVDGFFPPIPSETVVIALASLWASRGSPPLLPVILVAALGAFTGDQIAYTIGTRVKVRSLRIFARPKAQQALDWAERSLATRGASFIIAARYIPVGRVAVNMTAGALRYRRRRFVGITALAAVTWATYSSVIGIASGVVLKNHPMIGLVVGVVGGLVIGALVDWVLSAWARRPGGSRSRSGAAG